MEALGRRSPEDVEKSATRRNQAREEPSWEWEDVKAQLQGLSDVCYDTFGWSTSEWEAMRPAALAVLSLHNPVVVRTVVKVPEM